jgi:hypothetical protein
MRKFKLVADAQQFQGTHTAVSANQLSGSQAYQDRLLSKKAKNLGQADLGQANLGQANLGRGRAAAAIL